MSLNAYVKDTGMSGRRAPEGSQSELIVLLNPFLVNLLHIHNTWYKYYVTLYPVSESHQALLPYTRNRC